MISGDVDFSKLNILIGSDITQADLVLPLARQAHKESYFADVPFEAEVYESMVRRALENPGYYGCLYADYDGDPVGFALYMLRPLMGSKKTWITAMHSLYIRSDLRSTPLGAYVWNRIMATVRAWSVPRGAKGMTFNVVSGIAIEESDTVIKSYGGTHLGGNYFIRI